MPASLIASQREKARLEAARLIRLVAPEQPAGTPIKIRQIDAAARLGWHVRRVRDIWHATARRIESFEMDALRAHESENSSSI